MKKKPGRVYIIGAGNIARRHAKTALDLPGGAELSAADPEPGARKAFRRLYPRARLFENAREMLKEAPESSDIVVVATPVFAHYSSAVAGLRSGRNVLCEKPLAMNKAQALRMLKLARERKLTLGCCSMRVLGSRVIEETRKLLRQGALGKLYCVNQIYRAQRARAGIEYQPASKWFLDKSKAGGGQLLDHGVYDFSVFNYIFNPGRVDVLSAWVANPETWLDLPKGTVFDVEEQVGTTLRYHLDDGGVVTVSYEFAACTHGLQRYIAEFQGTRGALTWDWGDNYWGGKCNLIYSYDRRGKVAVKKKRITMKRDFTRDTALPRFCAYLRGNKNSRALVNGQAVFNFACLMAVYDCMVSGKPRSVYRRDFEKLTGK